MSDATAGSGRSETEAAAASADAPFDADATRARLAGERGPKLWRSLEELRGSSAFREWLAREHPAQVQPFLDPPSRRDALKFVAASLALAGVSSCTRQPRETIVPWARAPEDDVPGRPLFFATAMPWPTGALGVLVESHMNRPTKVEGNPEHPASLGATDSFAQASVLALYDPDRTQVVLRRGRIATWNSFLTELGRQLAAQEARAGAGLRVLTRTVTSPTLARQMRALLARYPQARWHQWEPLNRDAERQGALLAFGQDAHARPRYGAADVIVSLDADFLGEGPASVRAMREVSERKRAALEGAAPQRLWVLEPTPTVTGGCADRRVALRPDEIERFVEELALALDGEGAKVSPLAAQVADELARNRTRALVVAGRGLSPRAHALVHGLSMRLGAGGSTLEWTRPVAEEPVDHAGSLRELVLAMRAGSVELLVVLDGNPVYDAPADLDFGGALAQVPFRVHLAHTEDETSLLCDWHVPRTHFLETWSDARAEDGTASIVQPLIAPLHQSRSDHELVAALLGRAQESVHETVRETWRAHHAALAPGSDFERWWRRALHEGVLPGTAFPPLALQARERVEGEAFAAAATGETVLVLRPDPTVWDGRFANDGWLQECPKPLTKLTWDNAALLSPDDARELGVENGDELELALAERSLVAPAWILPGQARGCVTLHLGYGRRSAGSLGDGRGVDAYRLRTLASPDHAKGLVLRRTGGRKQLASTQEHPTMEGRELVRTATLASFLEDPHVLERGREGHGEGHSTSLYPEHEYEGPAWGMVIDLNTCTGCSACVVACQAENNIPVVGPEEVARGREMHWIRVDRYFEGDPAAPRVHYQPVPCMHCENAPCEVVCPVNATVHSAEGLNEMVYNRCVGTRYCSNNCPYKVRRFNFFPYADRDSQSLALQRNPDVTVRSRGVMEKCTYCVQRINQARIAAKKEGRPVRDGEVRTACQQVCPAQAIVFGDLRDPDSAVTRLRSSPRVYGLLEELNTRPRTTYGAKLLADADGTGEAR